MKILDEKGQLLLEALLAVALIAVLSVSFVGVVLVSTRAQTTSISRTQSSLLAKEGMEAVRAIAQENWMKLYNPMDSTNKGSANPYHPDISVTDWVFDAGTDPIVLDDKTYTRKVIIDDVNRLAGDIVTSGGFEDPSTQKVTVEVSSTGFATVTLIEYFTRWENKVFYQTDWSGGLGSTVPVDPEIPINQYISGSNIDDTSIEGIKLSQ